MKIRKTNRDEKIELQMTPMIDIVFQLLIFFIMTFKIILPEGDFNIKMPTPSSESVPNPDDLPPMQIIMTADANGELEVLRLDDENLNKDFLLLREKLLDRVGGAGGPGTAHDEEVELVPDFDLNYVYTVRALTAVSGYVDKTGQRHKLIEKIRFSPPEDRPL